MVDNYLHDYLEKYTTEFAKEYEKRALEILDSYFGKVPREFDELGKWIQEKRNQGYHITQGQDLNCIFQTQGMQVHYLTIYYNKEIVLKEIILTVDLNTRFKEWLNVTYWIYTTAYRINIITNYNIVRYIDLWIFEE